MVEKAEIEVRMHRILLIGTSIYSRNRGVVALASASIGLLKKCLGETDVVLFHSFPDYYDVASPLTYYAKEMRTVKDSNPYLWAANLPWRLLRAMTWATMKKLFGINMAKLVDEKVLREYMRAEVVIDLGYGDGFTDDYGFQMFVSCLFQKLLAIILGKRLIVFPQSIGPFRRKISLFAARSVLNRAAFVVARESITYDYLKKIGIRSPIFLSSDVAFLLEKAPQQRILEILSAEQIPNDKPLIGLSISQHINLKYSNPSDNSYIQNMVRTIDYLIETLDATIILVPHSTSVRSNDDDRIVGALVRDKVKERDRVILIDKEYSSEELKGIISCCSLFMGARMHANIAALSSGVPTIAIAYSHKTYGIMRELGQENWICDYAKMEFAGQISRINHIWRNRQEIREALTRHLKAVQEKVIAVGELVRNCLENNAK
ncbi:MAG: polysaccharide pyruvyl transferase family protein [Chloroflexi bacterium]|nr:polysaccharide pyruvyl transferase family protein [Chloroflexota bacterium]